jgi:GNAT superfamily N-acetyltransferase
MPEVRELGPAETALAFTALRELRPHLTSSLEFVARVNGAQRAAGYRLLAAFAADNPEPVAVAGFRLLHTLAWGHVLYVDDLVTLETYRGQGYAGAIFAWLLAEAGRQGCDQFHLDSGVQRFAAHRFYHDQGMRITSHHFQRDLERS